MNLKPRLARCALLAGCAVAGLPAREAAGSPEADTPTPYQRHVQQWTGHLEPKIFSTPFPRMPSDARLLPVDSQTQANTSFQDLRAQFRRWCAARSATPADRALDMQTPGEGILMCESGGQRLAALRIHFDLDAQREGRRELLIQHWYPPQIDEYIADVNASLARMAAQDRDRRDGDAAQARREAQVRSDADLRLVQERARAAALPTSPGCKAFERLSNALRTRLAIGVELQDARRQLADLAVAYDECEGQRAAAPQALLAVYRFNLQSFGLWIHAWEAGLMPSTASVAADDDRRRLLALQARFPMAGASTSGGPQDVVGRTIKFALER